MTGYKLSVTNLLNCSQRACTFALFECLAVVSDLMKKLLDNRENIEKWVCNNVIVRKASMAL